MERMHYDRQHRISFLPKRPTRQVNDEPHVKLICVRISSEEQKTPNILYGKSCYSIKINKN